MPTNDEIRATIARLKRPVDIVFIEDRLAVISQESGRSISEAAAMLTALLAEREWRPITEAMQDNAPRLVSFDETIPGLPSYFVASWTAGTTCNDLGYTEFANSGAWMVWYDPDTWALLSHDSAIGVLPLPAPPEKNDA
jgi:hypothetical protein